MFKWRSPAEINSHVRGSDLEIIWRLTDMSVCSVFKFCDLPSLSMDRDDR